MIARRSIVITAMVAIAGVGSAAVQQTYQERRIGQSQAADKRGLAEPFKGITTDGTALRATPTKTPRKAVTAAGPGPAGARGFSEGCAGAGDAGSAATVASSSSICVTRQPCRAPDSASTSAKGA